MNAGPNKGRRLRGALSRFAAMLIEEAADITGLSHAQLDERLGLPDGQAERYSLYPRRKKTRAPQAASIQQLENRVARLVQRMPHKVVIENNAKLAENPNGLDHIEGAPGDGVNLRQYSSLDFQLGYEGDWPIYRRLKYNLRDICCPLIPIHELVRRRAHGSWGEMLMLYSWQWGVLWDQGLPWLDRGEYGVSADAPVDSFLPGLAAYAKSERVRLQQLSSTAEGRRWLEIVEAELALS